MSRLPELEQELVATAARLSNTPRRFERRARALIPALALACLVAAALVASGLFDADEAGVHRGGARAAASGGFPADATLEDMLGVFRRPQTAADDMGIKKDQMNEIPDRQPGEDFTKSRRVEWPGVRIFLWPMRDGVCYGVPGGSGCPPLDALRRTGVSIGGGSGPEGHSLYGVVVDGIREVVLTAKDGPELRVPVRENFFYADLKDARVDRVRWRYAGQDQSSSTDGFFPEETEPPPPDPNASFKAIPGSFSTPVRFTAAGKSYGAMGYQATNDTICVRVSDGQRRPSLGCQGIRGLRDRLAEQPAELFAAGGTWTGRMQYTGFARASARPLPTTGQAT
jgi:hypothetical protein